MSKITRRDTLLATFAYSIFVTILTLLTLWFFWNGDITSGIVYLAGLVVVSVVGLSIVLVVWKLQESVKNYISTHLVWVWCFGFGLFWVYGTFIMMTVGSSLWLPLSIQQPVVSFFTAAFTSRLLSTWYVITVNNAFIFMLYMMTPYNFSIPFTGLIMGCIFGVNGFHGADVIPVLLPTLMEPFAVLELGAYVVAVTMSFYRVKMGDVSGRRFLMVMSLGLCMLILAGVLEWNLIMGGS